VRVSVIITHYRNGMYLQEAVASVLAQTRPADEIFVVDDATPPHEAAVLDTLPPAVRLIRLDRNSGPGAARQVGVDHATGDWLAYLDADDLWEPTKLERQLAFLAEHPEAVALHCGITVFSGEGAPVRQYLEKPAVHEGRQAVLYGHGLPSGLMHRRDAVLRVGGWSPDRRLMDDWDMEIRITNQCGPLWFVAEPLARLRRASHGNLSSQPWPNIRKLLYTAWHHRALSASHHGRGIWRTVGSRLLRGEGRKAGRVNGALIGLIALILRTGAPPMPPR
jgi:glycosyltransferase involved in cell wall biosynthesis